MLRAWTAALGSVARHLRQQWHVFAAGALCVLLLLYGGRSIADRTPLADWLVAPLLLDDTAGNADAIVVPGAGIIGDCTPNQPGILRVLIAARAWREKRAPLIVFTGGRGGGTCAIAEAMALMAADIGVDRRQIVVETRSRSTYENGERSAPLLRSLGVRRVLIVTDRLHMRRAAAVFTAFGFEVERASVPLYQQYGENISMLEEGSHELLGLAYYQARGWLTPSRPSGHTSAGARGATTKMDTRRYPSGPLVLLGASYVQGWRLQRVNDVPVINAGVSGQQSFEMLERFDRDVVAAKPRAVLLWGFINDIFRAPAGQVEHSLDRARDSYRQMVARAKQNGIEPMIATEITLRPPDSIRERVGTWVNRFRGKESYQDGINRHVQSMNRWLVDFASQEGLLLLDFQAALADDDGRRRAAFVHADGSHVSDAGYAALSEYALPVLERHVISE